MEYNFFHGKTKAEAEQEAVVTLRKWGINYPEEKETAREILREITETGRNGRIKDADQGIFLSALLYADDDRLVERALQRIYYLITASDDDDNAEKLFDYCRDAFEEKRELVRGRKHWVAIALMERKENSGKEIETYIRKLKDKEVSPWVWERIFGVIRSWDEAFRIYPELESWDIPEGDSTENRESFYGFFVNRYSLSLTIHHGVLERFPGLVQLVLDKKMHYQSLNWMMQKTGKAKGSFPLSADVFKKMYTVKDHFYRNVLLNYVSLFLIDGEWKKIIPYIDIILNTPPLENNLYEKRSHLLIRAFAFMERKTSDSPFDDILDFLTLKLEGEYRKTEIYFEMASSFTPLLLRLITDRSEYILDPEKISKILNHESLFYRELASSIVLHAVRSGYDIQDLIDILKDYLENNPSSTNKFAKGSDIKQDELNFKYYLGSVKSYVEPEEDNNEGDFFSYPRLTGLLEACKPPEVSYRVALALRTYAEDSNHRDLINFLSRFAEQNSALKDLKPVNIPAAETGPVLSSFMTIGGSGFPPEKPETPFLSEYKTEEVPEKKPPAGPMRLPEITELFSSAVSSGESLESLASAKQKEIAKRYNKINTVNQRNGIKAIFGDMPNEGEKETSHFASIFYRLKDNSYDQSEFCKNDLDGTIDAYACYVSQYGDNSLAHIYGIHFFARRCTKTINNYKLNTELFIRTIAVHELFHAHMDLMLGEKGKNHFHKGENPSYCRLEEAAADFVARKWLHSQSAAEEDIKAVSEVLFQTVENGGKKGYGEYHLMDDEVHEFLPGMIGDNSAHIMPPKYKIEKIKMDWGVNINRQKAKMIWDSLLAEIDEEVIPYYFNWKCR